MHAVQEKSGWSRVDFLVLSEKKAIFSTLLTNVFPFDVARDNNDHDGPGEARTSCVDEKNKIQADEFSQRE